MRLYLVLALIPLALGAMVPAPGPVLQQLSGTGGARIVTAIKAASNDLSSKQTAFQTAQKNCQNYIDNKTEKQCVPCVVDKCKRKADSCGRKLDIVSGAIKSISDLGSKVSSTAKNVVNKVVNTGKKVIESVGKVFKGWGKRRAIVKRAEPSCDEIKNNAGEACKKYSEYCASCKVDANRECSGYAAARTAFENSRNAHGWLQKVPKQGANYQIISLTYDPSSFDPAVQKMRTVRVQVNILGKRTEFAVNQPISPFDANTAGPVIAAQALDWYKRN